MSDVVALVLLAGAIFFYYGCAKATYQYLSNRGWGSAASGVGAVFGAYFFIIGLYLWLNPEKQRPRTARVIGGSGGHQRAAAGSGAGSVGTGTRPVPDEVKARRILGLDPDPSTKQVNKAYRRLAKTHHPDRGGDADQMAAINWAYAVLTDGRSTAGRSTAGGRRTSAA